MLMTLFYGEEDKNVPLDLVKRNNRICLSDGLSRTFSKALLGQVYLLGQV